VIAVLVDYFPLVLLDMGRAPRTAADFEHMFEAFAHVNRKATETETRYAVVAITTDTLSAGERRLLAEYVNRFPARDHALCAVAVPVVPSSILRGVVTALCWLIPRLHTVSPCATCQEAVQIAASRLRMLQIVLGDDAPRLATSWLLARQSNKFPFNASDSLL
jgi:hypothetical protein